MVIPGRIFMKPESHEPEHVNFICYFCLSLGKFPFWLNQQVYPILGNNTFRRMSNVCVIMCHYFYQIFMDVYFFLLFLLKKIYY